MPKVIKKMKDFPGCLREPAKSTDQFTALRKQRWRYNQQKHKTVYYVQTNEKKKT